MDRPSRRLLFCVKLRKGVVRKEQTKKELRPAFFGLVGLRASLGVSQARSKKGLWGFVPFIAASWICRLEGLIQAKAVGMW